MKVVGKAPGGGRAGLARPVGTAAARRSAHLPAVQAGAFVHKGHILLILLHQLRDNGDGLLHVFLPVGLEEDRLLAALGADEECLWMVRDRVSGGQQSSAVVSGVSKKRK